MRDFSLRSLRQLAEAGEPARAEELDASLVHMLLRQRARQHAECPKRGYSHILAMLV